MAEMTAEERAKERLARFQMAKKKVEEEKANQGGFPKEEIPDFECCVLGKENPKIIRLIGNTPSMRDKPTDPLIVKRSFVVGDDGNYSTIILSDDKDHPVNRLFRDILGKYDYDKANKTRNYHNKGKPSFERFIRNGKSADKCSNIERGMMPDTFYLFNCIDKTDNWCKEHKHTKLLCWDSTSKEVDGETRTYYTYGIKPSLYNEIFDVQCTTLNRHYEDFDFVVKRLKEKLGDSYLTVLSPEEKSKITNMKLDASKVTMDYLSEEEESYEKYVLEDIPFISRPTSAGYVLKILPNLIKQADIDFHNGEPILYNAFVEWKEKEIAELKKNNSENKKSEEDSSNSNEDTEDENIDVESEVVEEKETTPSFNTMESVETNLESDDLPSEVEENPTPTVTKKVAKVSKSTAFDIVSLYDKFPHLKDLSDDEKSLVVGEENGILKFKSGIEIAQCPICCEHLIEEGHSQEEIDSLGLADIPDEWTKCGICGTSFE